MTASGHDVRFTPESGHVRCTVLCPLCANSGHIGDNFSDENTAMRDMALDEPFAGSTGGHNLSCMQSSRKSICFHVRIRCFFFASSSFRLHSRNFCRSCDKRFLTASKCVRIERRGAATGLSFWAKAPDGRRGSGRTAFKRSKENKPRSGLLSNDRCGHHQTTSNGDRHGGGANCFFHVAPPAKPSKLSMQAD